MVILVLSDLHLGYENCNIDILRDFLDHYSKPISDLVLLGDIFEFWRRNNAEVVIKTSDIMAKINHLNAEKIHYVAGNHDYYILDLNKRHEVTPCIVTKSLRLKEGGESYFFIHGYQLESILWEFPASLRMYEEFSNQMCYNQNTVGEILSKIWDIIGFIGKKQRFIRYMNQEPHLRNTITNRGESGNTKLMELALSEGKYPLLGMMPKEKLIFGHTHWPFINKEKTVANTGSWIDEINKEKQNSYIEISKGEMELKFWPKDKTN